MTARTKLSNKLISIFLCVVLVMGCLPLSVISANAASSNPIDRVADPSTIDDWKEFFLPEDGSISTENAGGVWTNKSVFTETVSDNGVGISRQKIDEILNDRVQSDSEDKDSNGIGVSNVISRLRLFYKREDVVEITSAGEDCGTEVALYIPYDFDAEIDE